MSLDSSTALLESFISKYDSLNFKMNEFKVVKKESFVVLIDKSLEHTYSNSCILLAFYPNTLMHWPCRTSNT